MKKYALPILLPFVIAFITYCYDSYIGKYRSLFLTCFFNLIAATFVTIVSYCMEKDVAISNLKSCIKEPYFIPYILVLPSTYFLWFFITKDNGAAYAGLFESTYILIFIFASLLIGNKNFDWQFIVAAFMITSGVILLNYRK